MSPQTIKTAQPIAGYEVKERIGAGGYGEVWKAQAPGGLTKAIKFVYGFLDDDRAMRELKALNRIKEVRHPFLLSIERIEVVDRQLVIVTELADASLKDRFEQCRREGLPGIPRDELLVYLRDAADALDYMSEQHSLAHLDVKPENLLFVGGRVKVADFGLTKDIHDATMSIMGGLTPVYAPPEVFDGRPSLSSDQYSLAIVYQEMLTGSPPFPGKTVAQLAAQHLNSKPRLSSLPSADQPIVARALSKQPEQRLTNCRALIDGLLDPTHFATGGAAAQGPDGMAAAGEPKAAFRPVNEDESAAMMDTVMVGELPPARSHAAAPAAFVDAPFVEEPATITELPPIEMTVHEIRLRPTVFIGIGGTAARTLRRLRQRMRDRIKDLSNVPAFQMLLLDTDPRTIGEACQGDPGAPGLGPHETMSLPLRRPEDYRSDNSMLLQSISRRWLYNIPRSLQTGGLRPLGRMAYVDHARAVLDRIAACIAAAVAPDALATTAANLGVAFGPDAPRVFIVASVSGGAGSGMVLDVGYAVRTALAGLNLPDDGMCGVLVHSSDRAAQTKDLAIANAYSCLSELAHYRRRGYPGDAAGGLPAYQGGRGPLGDTYLVDLGQDLNEEDYGVALDRVAEYLYRGSMTTASVVLDKCRASPPAAPGVGAVRTFGVCHIGCTHGNLLARAAAALCQALVVRWHGEDVEARQESFARPGHRPGAREPRVSDFMDSESVERLAAERADVLELNVDRLVQQVCDLLEAELGTAPETWFRQTWLEYQRSDAAGAVPESGVSRMMAAISGLLGPSGDDAQSLRSGLEDRIKELAARLGTAIREWTIRLVNFPSGRLLAAQTATHWFAQHLRSLEKKIAEVVERLELELAAVERSLGEASAGGRAGGLGLWPGGNQRKAVQDIERRLLDSFRLRLYGAALHGAGKLAHSMGRHVVGIADHVKDLRRSLDLLGRSFALPGGIDAADGRQDAISELHAAIGQTLWKCLPELADRLDHETQTGLLEPEGGLSTVLADANCTAKALPELLRVTARFAIRRALREINVAGMITPDAGSPQPLARLRGCLQHAVGRSMACGGARRLVLMLPEGTDPAALRDCIQQESQHAVSVAFDADGDVVLCYEVEQVPLRRAAAALIEHHEECAAIAARLHTRVDVEWSDLNEHSRSAEVGRAAL